MAHRRYILVFPQTWQTQNQLHYVYKPTYTSLTSINSFFIVSVAWGISFDIAFDVLWSYSCQKWLLVSCSFEIFLSHSPIFLISDALRCTHFLLSGSSDSASSSHLAPDPCLSERRVSGGSSSISSRNRFILLSPFSSVIKVLQFW